MRQKLFIFLALIFLIIILIGLNAASYVQKEQEPDKEFNPNRSTYNVGATGTRAFYDLLAESGFNVKRWREPFKRLNSFEPTKLSTFVIIGKTRRKLTKNETQYILDWVEMGGTLVIIDRSPPPNLASTTAPWHINPENDKQNPIIGDFEDEIIESNSNKKEENKETQKDTTSKIEEEIEKESKKGASIFTIDPSNQQQMTLNTKAAKPSQPTIFTKDINSIQPSKFASSISFTRFEDTEEENLEEPEGVGTSDEAQIIKPTKNFQEVKSTPPPPPKPKEIEGNDYIVPNAPVIHLTNDNKNILADFPYGAGNIILLSDPYIVTNGGVRLLDNLQLGINIVTSKPGVIAFDEYHQGYGNNENRLLSYFEGTPVIAIFLQLIALIGLIFYSQSRRFARALPPNNPNRLSKLEYVSAMAQVQQRTKAFDLAIENIYKDFRRRVSRLLGVDNQTVSREKLAKLIAERTDFEVNELEDTMFKCEDIMHGEPTNKKEIIKLTSRLREIEKKLGLARSKRKTQ